MLKKVMFLTLVMILLAGCLPAQTPQDISSQVNTAVAQTAQANTEIAFIVEQTVSAQQPAFTPTLAFSPTAEPTFEIINIITDTPFPTNTPIPASGGSSGGSGSSGSGGSGGSSGSSGSAYSCAIVNEKPYDGATFKPGDSFDKSWTIKNNGTVTWDASWDFEYKGGTDISPTGDFSIGQQVKPGQTITIVIEVDVPEVAFKDSGKIFVMTWSLNNGSHFCTPYVAIKVVP